MKPAERWSAGLGRASGAEQLRILIVTDAWAPQVNGVVRTLEILGRDLVQLGHEVRFSTPADYITVPLPSYPEIRLALFARRRLTKLFRTFRPDAIHIATEGTLGLAARAICRRHAIPFTTSFHTRFPDYIHARLPIVPEEAVYRALRWFHGPATAVMAATPSLQQELEAHGFHNVRLWSRGVDVEVFHPLPGATLPYPRPIFLYVGRIAVEKNIEAFLRLDLPGTKLVVGDGPARAQLARRYDKAVFTGPLNGAELINAYAASDVFVFPSRTDTFGLVLLEALACGTPVAAFPVQGPRDVLGDAAVACLDEDLKRACLRALKIPRASARAYAMTRSWRACTAQFLTNLAVDPAAR